MTIKCKCKDAYQDEKYGKGNRVFNPTLKGKGGPIVYRCTICENEKTFTQEEMKNVKK